MRVSESVIDGFGSYEEASEAREFFAGMMKELQGHNEDMLLAAILILHQTTLCSLYDELDKEVCNLWQAISRSFPYIESAMNDPEVIDKVGGVNSLPSINDCYFLPRIVRAEILVRSEALALT